MDALVAVAHALADGDREVWHRILRDHVAASDGRCRVCRLGAARGRPQWPCRLHAVAVAAAAVVDERLRSVQ